MRNSGGRIKNADLKKLQKSAQQKFQKQVQVLIQLIDLPDYDVSEFFQALLKNKNYTQILQKMPRQKQIDFFARNYESFLESQQELLELNLPLLDAIPKAKQYHIEQQSQAKKEQTSEQATFTCAVKNNGQILRIHQIIIEMRKHSKYQKYFNQFSIAKTYRQYYNAFVQSCTDYRVLLQIGQKLQAIKIYLKQKLETISREVQTTLNISSQTGTIQKQMLHLIDTIQLQIKNIKIQFRETLNQVPESQVYISNWISELGHNFYQLVEPSIFEKQELSDILQALSAILQASKEAESRAVSLQRQLKNLICSDLPVHMQKVVEVVLQAFQNLLKDDNQLYQFIHFETIKSFSQASENFIPISQSQFHKKCATQKGIFLINSFQIILRPICQPKWYFLQQNTLKTLLQKINISLTQTQMHYWDYYYLFKFLDKLSKSGVGNKKLRYSNQNKNLDIQPQLQRADKISKQCWVSFEQKITKNFYKVVLSEIPAWIWSWKKYATKEQPQPLSPSSFSIRVVVALEDFFKQIQFRLKLQAFKLVVLKFYQYLNHTFEYVLFYGYHKKGSNEKVFYLNKISQQMFQKAKQFPYQEIEVIKQKKVLELQYFTKSELRKFIFEIYLVHQFIKIMIRPFQLENMNSQNFNNRLCQVYSKDRKLAQMYIVKKQDLIVELNKYCQRYINQPELFRKYIEESSKKSESVSHGQSNLSNKY